MKLKLDWGRGWGWAGAMALAGSLHGQGISAVTRPVRMAGPPMAAMGGTLPATLPGGGGGGGLATHPNWVGAAAMLGPVLAGSASANAGQAVASGPGPAAAAARAAVARPPAFPPADPAELRARVLAFQQERARQGSSSAQLALGRRYLAGDGVERNEEVGRVWLAAAARQGSTEAQEALRQLGPAAAAPKVPAVPAGLAAKD
ncbi:MAG: hypothetical protein ACKOET_04060 [Verrucomicrobiota bacterium]